jgi:hypothetical protein
LAKVNKGWLVLYMRRHHLWVLPWRNRLLRGRWHILVIVVIVVTAALASEVSGPLVFMWLSILHNISYIHFWYAYQDTHILVSADGLIDVSRGELVELLVVTKYDDGDIDGAKDGQFVRFLEQTAFTFEKGSSLCSD